MAVLARDARLLRARVFADTGVELDGTLNSLEFLGQWLDGVDPWTYQDDGEGLPFSWRIEDPPELYYPEVYISSPWVRLQAQVAGYLGLALHDAIPGAAWVSFRNPKMKNDGYNGSPGIYVPGHPIHFVPIGSIRAMAGLMKLGRHSVWMGVPSWTKRQNLGPTALTDFAQRCLQGTTDASWDRRVNPALPGSVEDHPELTGYHDVSVANYRLDEHGNVVPVAGSAPAPSQVLLPDDVVALMRGEMIISSVPPQFWPQEPDDPDQVPRGAKVITSKKLADAATKAGIHREGDDWFTYSAQWGEVAPYETRRGKPWAWSGKFAVNPDTEPADLQTLLHAFATVATTLGVYAFHADTLTSATDLLTTVTRAVGPGSV